MTQQAKVLFVGACAISPGFAQPGEIPVFLQMWDINDARYGTAETRDRAVIVPDPKAHLASTQIKPIFNAPPWLGNRLHMTSSSGR